MAVTTRLRAPVDYPVTFSVCNCQGQDPFASRRSAPAKRDCELRGVLCLRAAIVQTRLIAHIAAAVDRAGITLAPPYTRYLLAYPNCGSTCRILLLKATSWIRNRKIVNSSGRN